jgi:uracil-DNA glycosylase
MSVPPGTGWPGDPATPATPVACDAAEVSVLASGSGTLAELVARQSVCRACPRLVDWREQVAAQRRRAYSAEVYWGRPVPGWGDDKPAILIVGLAPAAHGGNRTGRIFTGDRSGDVLFDSLWRCGLAAQRASTSAADGQRLIGARMLATVRCAPPANKPSIAERDACAPWFAAELALVAAGLEVVICLGHFAWQAAWRQLGLAGYAVSAGGTGRQNPRRAPARRPAFGHGAEAVVSGSGGQLAVIGCYHPSQQNTFTGRVTGAMLDAVFTRARELAGLT